MTKKTMAEMVEEFNLNVVGVDATFKPVPLGGMEFDWLIHALKEEVGELEDADSHAEQIDALCDLIYFALGGFIRMGLSPGEIDMFFQFVHGANMLKASGKKESRGMYGETKDAVKPKGWVAPEILIEKYLSYAKDQKSR